MMCVSLHNAYIFEHASAFVKKSGWLTSILFLTSCLVCGEEKGLFPPAAAAQIVSRSVSSSGQKYQSFNQSVQALRSLLLFVLGKFKL